MYLRLRFEDGLVAHAVRIVTDFANNVSFVIDEGPSDSSEVSTMIGNTWGVKIDGALIRNWNGSLSVFG